MNSLRWKNFALLIGLFLANLVLESNLFINMDLLGLRPDSIIAVTIAVALVAGSGPGALYGAVVGLVMDALFNRYLGMSALGYTMIGFAVGFYSDKFYAHNSIFPAVMGFIAYWFKEGVIMIQMRIIASPFEIGSALGRYFLPSAALTGLLAIPMYYLYKKNKRIDMRRAKWDAYPTVHSLRNDKKY